MSLTSLLNLANSTSNPAPVQAQSPQSLQAEVQQPLTQTAGTAANAITTAPQDRFVASNQNPLTQATADAAGLFTVNQAPAFTGAANALLAKAPPPPATAVNPPANTRVPNATPAPAGATTLPQAAAAGGGGANPADVNALGANAATTATTSSTAAGATAAGTTSVQDQLQALNNALEALGLSSADISQIDRIASSTNNFNAEAFTSLAYELVALSQKPVELAATITANVVPTAATTANAAPTAATAGPPAGGAQGVTQVKAAKV